MPSGSDSSFVNIQTPTSPSTTVTEHRSNHRRAHIRTVSSTMTVAEMDTSLGDQTQWVDVPTSPKKREWKQASSPISNSVHTFLVERAVAEALASQSPPLTQSEVPEPSEPEEVESTSSSTNSSTTNFIDTLAQGALSLLTGRSSRTDEPAPPAPPLPTSPPRTPQDDDDDALAQQMAIASIWC